MTDGFALVDSSATVSSQQLTTLAEALALFWEDLVASWILPKVEFDVFDARTVPDDWVPVFFTDTIDQAGDYAYHDLVTGRPNIVIQVPVYAGGGVLVPNPDSPTCLAIGVSHEIAEAACDPRCDLVMPFHGTQQVALEVCDPVQDNYYLVQTSNGPVAMSDFVTPFWFELDATRGGQSFDKMGLVTAPGQVLHGYAIVYDEDGNSNEIFGQARPNDALRLASPRRGRRLNLSNPRVAAP